MPEARKVGSALERRIVALELELTDFSYIVSHDLGAPLRHIEGISELLTRNAGALPKELAGFVHLIRDAAGKAAQMVEQLLDYSRVQQTELNMVTCDVNHLVEHAQLQLEAVIGQSDVEVIASALGSIQGDRVLLTQVLRHIFDNASKFRRPGIKPRITINAPPDENSWIITVADNGIGVNIIEQERLFWMFGRGQTQYPGHGTGLTIARRILRRHGGDAQFIGADCGACVKISVPRLAAAARDRPA